jgi:Flp pilus assembly protein TadD
VYEELGSCFIQKQQYSVAVTVLNRAVTLPYKDESELLGVYYNLGRAHEELGQRAEARSAYEKIIAIDIGFGDTTERLSKL